MITTLFCGVCRPFGLTPNKGNIASQHAKTNHEAANGSPPPDVLRKELENELKSDSKDIRSYAWFHGRMPRDIAEDLMQRDGDFLIRESVTNVGDYVLTCKYKSAYYHFKINKTIVQKSPTYSVVQYCLEDDYFDSLPAMVLTHVGKKIPVSKNTGVILNTPVNRSIPISYSEVKYASLKRPSKGKSQTGSMKQWNNNNNAPTIKDIGSVRHHSPNSLSSSPTSSASSIDFHDRSGLSPRTPSPQHQVYSVPRTPSRVRENYSTSPAAVVLEERVVVNSYTPNGSRIPQQSTPTQRGYKVSPTPLQLQNSLGLRTPPPSSPSYANGKKNNPFPLTLFDGSSNAQNEVTKRMRGSGTGSQDPQVCVVNPVSNRPISQVDMNIESHGKHVSRTGSDPLLSPNFKHGPEASSPLALNSNNSNSKFTFQSNSEYANKEGKSKETSKNKNVPPKPSRVPSFKYPVIKGSPGSSSVGNNGMSGRLGSVKNSVSLLGDKRNAPPTISEVPETLQDVNYRPKGQSPRKMNKFAMRKKRASCFKPTQYQCTMLTSENRPLEANAILEMKDLLRVDPFRLARHMTVIDCKVCRIMEGDLERIMMPHGSQLRNDITERYQCIAFWVATCVFKCTSNLQERVEVLNAFIQVANELVHSMGNVFGFSAIMHGLTSPQVAALETAWDSLRLRFTNNAVTFEKKLRPLLRYLDEGQGQIRSSSTCIPHIMPIVRLLENPTTGVPHLGASESLAKKSASFGSLLDRTSPTGSMEKEDSTSLNSTGRDSIRADWWENLPDESFDSLISHLNSGRNLLTNLEEFKKNANMKLVDFKEMPKVREMFTTDFQMRLLFGYRGAESPRHSRYQKFDQIITAMYRLVVD